MRDGEATRLSIEEQAGAEPERGVTVRETLSTRPFDGARLEAGRAGLGRRIRWVHVLEAAEAAELLHGGEMVLTTGLGFGSDELRQTQFLTRLLERGVSCVCLELGSRLRELPRGWRQLAEEAATPLIVFPRTVRYVDITQELHSLILQRRQALSPAARADPEAALLRRALRGPEAGSADGLAHPLEGLVWRAAAAEWDSAPAAAAAADELRRRLRAAGFVCLAEARGPRLLAVAGQSARSAAGERLERTLRAALSAVPGGCAGASSRFAGAVGAEEARREAEEALRLCLLRQPQPAAARSAGGGGPATGGAAGGRATAGEAAGGAAGPYACEDAGELLCYEQLGVLQLLPALDDGRRLQAYVARHLGPLLEADRLRGGELLRTLQVFLDADGSKQEAARRLYVARQSLYYRLERIEELIGPVWLDPERRLAAELALRAYRLLHPGGLAGDAAR